MTTFDHRDREQFHRIGVDEVEIQRQLDRFRHGSRPAPVTRPCRRGDGIVVLDAGERARLIEIARGAAAAGRVGKFVPASGAATRMFNDLQTGTVAAMSRLEREAELLPFAAALRERGLSLDPPWSDAQRTAILDILLGNGEPGYAGMPKGLLPFHRYERGVRTALEEHVVEAARYARDAKGWCRLHVTVSDEHRERFDRWVRDELPALARRTDTRFDIVFSGQRPNTDTIAVDPSNEPFRLDDGSILFRPGGHGSLIHNLNALDADIVVIKNIDNVVRERDLPVVVEWKQILIGYVVLLQSEIHEWERRLEGDESDAGRDGVTDFLRTRLLCADADERRAEGAAAFRAFAIDRLQRPLRVCGVVPNDGEPGGGPFWVRDGEGRVSVQIVESSQIDMADPEQAAHVAAATHFNPVDLVCAVRDAHGTGYDLTRFVDPETDFISEKSDGGRPLRALEWPGLWNGSMAGWNTLLIEVPSETFAPVKTVFDLMRPVHQPSVAS